MVITAVELHNLIFPLFGEDSLRNEVWRSIDLCVSALYPSKSTHCLHVQHVHAVHTMLIKQMNTGIRYRQMFAMANSLGEYFHAKILSLSILLSLMLSSLIFHRKPFCY